MKARLGLHRLMYGLLFPAVLGTIFVVFINSELTHWSFNQRSFFGIVFITHWCLEFVLAGQEEYIARYGVFDFIGDFFLIIFMYKAFEALSEKQQAIEAGYQGLYFWVMMIPIAFLAVDVLNRIAAGHTLKRAIVWVDLIVLVIVSGFWVIALVNVRFRLSNSMAYLFIALVLLMSFASFVARKSRFIQQRAS